MNITPNDQLPTMRFIYESLIGEKVVVWLEGKTQLGGKLKDYNGVLIQLDGESGSISNTYIPVDKIIAISSEK